MQHRDETVSQRPPSFDSIMVVPHAQVMFLHFLQKYCHTRWRGSCHDGGGEVQNVRQHDCTFRWMYRGTFDVIPDMAPAWRTCVTCLDTIMGVLVGGREEMISLDMTARFYWGATYLREFLMDRPSVGGRSADKHVCVMARSRGDPKGDV